MLRALRLGARKRAPDDPARWWRPQRPARGVPDPEEGAPSPSESATAACKPMPLRLAGGALPAVVALLPVLALTAGALAPTALLSPAARTTAPAGSGPPARPVIPGGAGGDIDWTYSIGTLLDIVAGAAGPIVLTPEGVTAPNGEDGSVRWTYRRGADYADDGGGRADEWAYSGSALTVSPDARHVAVRIKGSTLSAQDRDEPDRPRDRAITLSVVLDSVTGEVTAEHRGTTSRSSFQMTDSLAVDGDEAFTLDGGTVLWTAPDGTFGRDDDGYSGTAGHSTVVVGTKKSCSTDNRFCRTSRTLRIAPDHDPTATTEVTHVLRDVNPRDSRNRNRGTMVVDGWAVRSTDNDARSIPDKYASPAWDAQAVDLDALASGEETAPVPLGNASGVNTVASQSSGALVTAALLDRPSSSASSSTDLKASWAETVFDPTTGTATPAAEYPGLAAARVGLRATVEDTRDTTSAVIEPADGSPGVSARVPPRTLFVPRRAAGSHNEAKPLGEDPSNMIAMSVPGATIIVLASKIPDDTFSRAGLIYGMAGEGR